MKKFFIVFSLFCFALPSLAYYDEYLAEFDSLKEAKKINAFNRFNNSDVSKITIQTCTADNECLKTTFYKIDDSFASTSIGNIINYKTYRHQGSMIIPQ